MPVITINDNVTVRFEGAVVSAFFHDIRMHSEPCVHKPQDYSLGWIISFGEQAEKNFRAQMEWKQLAA